MLRQQEGLQNFQCHGRTHSVQTRCGACTGKRGAWRQRKGVVIKGIVALGVLVVQERVAQLSHHIQICIASSN